jgi:hypothetical protein
MEREFLAHHIKEDSVLEHLIDSMQPRKYSEDYLKQYSKHSVMSSEVLDACRTRLRRAQGFVRPGAVRLLIGVEYSRVRIAHGCTLPYL